MLVVALATLAACSGGSRGSSSGSASPSTARGAAGTAAAAGVTTTPPPACAPFHGTTSKLQSIGPAVAGLLVDATAGAVGCVDAVTFTFTSLGDGTPPGYVVQYQDPAKQPFVDGDPPVPISLPGNAFLVVTMQPALSTNPLLPDNPQTYTGNLSLEYGDHNHLQIVRKLPDGNNTVSWVIGLDAVRPFIVDRAKDPTTITVYIG